MSKKVHALVKNAVLLKYANHHLSLRLLESFCLIVFIFLFFMFLVFLGLHLQHMEVPRLDVESEL